MFYVMDDVYWISHDKDRMFSVRCVQGDIIAPLCGGKAYDSATEFCQGGKNVILPLCNGKQYTDMQYCLSNGNINTYKTVTINTQTWLAENLNFAAEGSVCYDNDPANCDIYGRLYDWNTAMAGSASSTANPSGVQGVCPSGWHLPSDAEWDVLIAFVHSDNGLTSYTSGNSTLAGKYLKANSDLWTGSKGEDKYDFAALPGGSGDSDGDFKLVSAMGQWWSANEYNSDNAYYRFMDFYSEFARWNYNDKNDLLSVRCLQN
jgi:uncharacterized protein (TIGR02145 family)